MVVELTPGDKGRLATYREASQVCSITVSYNSHMKYDGTSITVS